MKRLILFISLSLLILAGCSVKKNENFTRVKIGKHRTIWVNQNVECCGVKDPINNLEWMKNTFYSTLEKCINYETSYGYIFHYYAFLFKNNITQENFVIVNSNYYSGISWVIIYNCDGTIIDQGDGRVADGEKYMKLFDVHYPDHPDFYYSAPQICWSCDSFYKKHTLVDTIAYFTIKIV